MKHTTKTHAKEISIILAVATQQTKEYYNKNNNNIKTNRNERYHTNKHKKKYNPYSKKYDIGNFEVNVDWDEFYCNFHIMILVNVMFHVNFVALCFGMMND